MTARQRIAHAARAARATRNAAAAAVLAFALLGALGCKVGPIDVPQAQGSNELLRDGAVAIVSMADAVALLNTDVVLGPLSVADTTALVAAIGAGSSAAASVRCPQ